MRIEQKHISASDYMDSHWIGNKVFKHTSWPKHRERFKRCANYCIGLSVADVGCACGHSTAMMAQEFGADFTGIDFSKNGIKAAIDNFPDIVFKYYETPDQMVEDNREGFDTVVCSEVIEHVQDDKEFVKNLMEIARNRLVMTTPCKWVSDPGHLRVYTESMLMELFDGIPRTGIGIQREHPFWYVIVDK